VGKKERKLKNGYAQKYRQNSPRGIRGVSPGEEKEGYGGKDLQKSEGVMDDESGESMQQKLLGGQRIRRALNGPEPSYTRQCLIAAADAITAGSCQNDQQLFSRRIYRLLDVSPTGLSPDIMSNQLIREGLAKNRLGD